MKRLTTREQYPHGAEGKSSDSLTGNYCRGVFEATAVVERLAYYENLEEDGKLMILPCKPGNTVYFIYMDCPTNFREEYCADHEGSCEKCHHRVGKILSKKFTLQDIGIPVYLTKLEAQEALKRIKHE